MIPGTDKFLSLKIHLDILNKEGAYIYTLVELNCLLAATQAFNCLPNSVTYHCTYCVLKWVEHIGWGPLSEILHTIHFVICINSCHHVVAYIMLMVYFTSMFPATRMNSKIKTASSGSWYPIVLWIYTKALE
jgi:hypothetical protein